MRKWLYILLMMPCATIYAQSPVSELYKQWMIEDINRGQFEKAVKEMNYVENWLVYLSEPEVEINPDKVLEYVRYMESVVTKPALQDSFLVYATRNLRYYGLVYYNNREYVNVKRHWRICLAAQRMLLGYKHPDIQGTLMDLGTICYEDADYVNAEKYYLEAIEVAGELVGKNDSTYAGLLNALGMVYEQEGRYSEGEKYFQQAADLYKSIFGELNAHYAASINNLGNMAYAHDDYTKAEQYFLRAYEIRKIVLSENDMDFGTSLHSLGVIYNSIGDYPKALHYTLKALELRDKYLVAHDASYALTLMNIGILYGRLGDIEKAEYYLLQALDFHKNILGERHQETAKSLFALGYYYSVTQEYQKAEQYMLQALDIQKNTIGEHHPDYHQTLNAIGILYGSIGDYQKMERCLLKALELCKSASGEQNLKYSTILENMGLIYLVKKDYEKAEECFLQSAKIEKQLLGERHKSFAGTLENLSLIYVFTGDFRKAEEYQLRALDIKKELFGCNNILYAEGLVKLSKVYSNMDNFPLSKAYYLQAFEILKSTYGENDIKLASNYDDLGDLYYYLANYQTAMQYYLQAYQLKRADFLKTLNFMTEDQRENYWYTYGMYNKFVLKYPACAYYYYPQLNSISTFAYDNELFHKGLLLSSSNDIRYSILHSGDSTLLHSWDELMALKQIITQMKQSAPQTDYLSKYQEKIDSLEKTITISSAVYRENIQLQEITWDSVRKKLQPNQVAIEYMIASIKNDSVIYCALLLRDTCQYPILIPLFEQTEVDSLVNTSNLEFINNTYAYGENGKLLFKYIWSKILPYLNEGDVVFFSPVGYLHPIAIENLPYDSTRTIGDVYKMVRLSSTRELVVQHDTIPHATATLYGGIHYGVTPDEMYANNIKYRNLRNSSAEDLPGTKKEIEAITPILQKKNIKVHVFSNDTANEESFKSLSGKEQSILHIGTHGFYWSDSTAKKQEYTKQLSISMSNESHILDWSYIDPLHRCGLLFAGANTALAGDAHRLEKGVDDGILTAKEISLMDLRGTDIVVLSACETGLGDITGDGVFGLQRGFKMAGAQTILMSLWKVHDDATRLLMTSFYRHYANGLTKREAFRKAQQEVRNYTGATSESEDRFYPSQDKFLNKTKHTSGSTSHSDKNIQPATDNNNTHPYAAPYYWAGFILLD